MFLRNDKQKVVTDSYPYLCVHGIFGGSVECLYVQMLLYPFEEQLNLPSLPVQLGNGQCLKLKVVGEETVNCICAKVFIDNKSKKIDYAEIVVISLQNCIFGLLATTALQRIIHVILL